MTKQQTPEEEFTDFMSGRSELSSVYQQTHSDEPNECTDEHILAAARQSVTEHTNSASTTGIGWYIPLAIAAGIAVLAVLLALQFYPGDSTDVDVAKQPDQREVVSNLKPEPANLLTEIVQLVKDGKTDLAREQFLAFRQLYPEFPLDYQLYPELKAFKAEK